MITKTKFVFLVDILKFYPLLLFIIADNKSKRRRKDRKMKTDFTVFAEKSENQRIHISPQLMLATYQFLSTCKFFFQIFILILRIN